MIEEQIVRQLIELNQKVEGMAIPEKSPDPISPFLALPGLVGFWPMSSVQRSTGDVGDISGNIIKQDLTNNNTVTFPIYNSLIPYGNFVLASSQYLSVADNTDLDIIGNESQFPSPGLTLGGWFWADASTTSMACMAKGTAATPAYHLRIRGDSADELQFIVVSGAAATGATGSSGDGTLASDGIWMFVVGRFIPSVEVAVFRGTNKTVNVAAIPATIDNVAGGFQIGAFADPAQFFDGRATLCFLCANALPDTIISSLFEQTRALFGV